MHARNGAVEEEEVTRSAATAALRYLRAGSSAACLSMYMHACLKEAVVEGEKEVKVTRDGGLRDGT
jgi:hypothetical protein